MIWSDSTLRAETLLAADEDMVSSELISQGGNRNVVMVLVVAKLSWLSSAFWNWIMLP